MKRTRTDWNIMKGLLAMVGPLWKIMGLAIVLGTIGNLMASFVPIFGAMGLASYMDHAFLASGNAILIAILVCGIFRGVVKYAEQACNHYIAFRLLALIRHKIFAVLRRLAPAKLDGKDKGALIATITSDIEQLEVFYAHTISPVMIALFTTLVMEVLFVKIHPLLGVVALFFYVLVGVVVPCVNRLVEGNSGIEYRSRFGQLNQILLDNLLGLREILQFSMEEKRKDYFLQENQKMEEANRRMKEKEALSMIGTDILLMVAGIVMFLCSGRLALAGLITVGEAVVATVAMMSSFGPVVALAALSNTLRQTLASGERVLDLLEEMPVCEDLLEGADWISGDIAFHGVDFSYEKGEMIPFLTDFTHEFPQGKTSGIHGSSGCGKSTLLKLLMRYYLPNAGEITYGITDVNQMKTEALRKSIAFVDQDTFLFSDTIEANIRLGNLDATREEVEEAAKKASIHEMIMSLPNGYETKLSELGESVSSGERQRIGLARAFLHDASYLFLDEPTSNIDSLNEGMILKSIRQYGVDHTVLLVSHRESTMKIAEEVLEVPFVELYN